MKKYLYGVTSFVLAFVILSVSVLRSSSVSQAYSYNSSSPPPSIIPNPPQESYAIDYVLPYPGRILPDNWLWYIKALRDKIQYFVARDNLKKADLNLLYADKRLGASLTLFENKKPDVAIGVLAKGEKYLEEAFKDEKLARESGVKTDEFLVRLAKASLMHRSVIENRIMQLAPEDLRPEVVKLEDYSKETYKELRGLLGSKGIPAPKDPFNGQ